MRLQHLLPVFAAATATLADDFDASQFLRRDLMKRDSGMSLVEQAQTDLANLTTITNDITAALKNFTDLNGVTAILNSNTELLDALAAGVTNINAYPGNLSSQDALDLGAPTQFLAYAANISIATLIGKKPVFEQFGIASTVVTSVQQQISGSANFSTALIAKIPEHLKAISASLNSQVSNSLNMGLQCFSKNETCSSAQVDPNRTLKAAQDSGAIPKTSDARSMTAVTWVVVSVAVAVGAVFA